jgi:hypothetical protein
MTILLAFRAFRLDLLLDRRSLDPSWFGLRIMAIELAFVVPLSMSLEKVGCQGKVVVRCPSDRNRRPLEGWLSDRLALTPYERARTPVASEDLPRLVCERSSVCRSPACYQMTNDSVYAFCSAQIRLSECAVSR